MRRIVESSKVINRFIIKRHLAITLKNSSDLLDVTRRPFYIIICLNPVDRFLMTLIYFLFFSRHIALGLDGVEIISNGSGSYMELRKAYVTVDLVKSATFKSGGAYLFSNLRGCDGQRIYFNGCSCVALNGQIVSRGLQFALVDVVSGFFPHTSVVGVQWCLLFVVYTHIINKEDLIVSLPKQIAYSKIGSVTTGPI